MGRWWLLQQSQIVARGVLTEQVGKGTYVSGRAVERWSLEIGEVILGTGIAPGATIELLHSDPDDPPVHAQGFPFLSRWEAGQEGIFFLGAEELEGGARSETTYSPVLDDGGVIWSDLDHYAEILRAGKHLLNTSSSTWSSPADPRAGQQAFFRNVGYALVASPTQELGPGSLDGKWDYVDVGMQVSELIWEYPGSNPEEDAGYPIVPGPLVLRLPLKFGRALLEAGGEHIVLLGNDFTDGVWIPYRGPGGVLGADSRPRVEAMFKNLTEEEHDRRDTAEVEKQYKELRKLVAKYGRIPWPPPVN